MNIICNHPVEFVQHCIHSMLFDEATRFNAMPYYMLNDVSHNLPGTTNTYEFYAKSL